MDENQKDRIINIYSLLKALKSSEASKAIFYAVGQEIDMMFPKVKDEIFDIFQGKYGQKEISTSLRNYGEKMWLELDVLGFKKEEPEDVNKPIDPLDDKNYISEIWRS